MIISAHRGSGNSRYRLGNTRYRSRFTRYMERVALLIVLVLVMGLESCFEDIDTVKLEPLDTFTAVNSIETVQTFYKIEENEIRMVVFNGPSDWDLGFETGEQGNHVIINYSAAARIIGTGISDFNAVDINTANDFLPVNDMTWRFDQPSGILDSTAIGNWSDSNMVYILFRGFVFDNSVAYYKIKIESVDDSKYLLSYSDLNTDVVNEVTIIKDDRSSFVYFSFTEDIVNLIDPGKNEWDLLFTPYYGYYQLMTGSEQPYFLRGVYTNYLNGVEVYKINDANLTYEEINSSHIGEYEGSSLQNAIGYDWKQIPQPPDYRYYVNENLKYIIHTPDGNYYKFRFVSFYNELDEKGYPIFEYKSLL